MYTLKYYSTFKDLSGNVVKLEIYKDMDETAVAEELLLSADAVSIEYSSDDLFKPLKQSGCSVNILTGKILTDLYTGKLNDVILKVYKNDSLFWFGYLTPNIYSSEFSSDYDLLTLEFVDSIAQLENIKYSYIGNKGAIRSFYEVMVYILDKIDSEKIIDKIYLHNALQVNSSNDLLNKLMIQERNFFDEEEEPETCKEVLEDILSYLGMSLIQFEDKYLILDYQAIKTGNYKFIVYDRNDKTNQTVILPSDLRNLQDIGIYESNASISLGNVYNKINLISNNNGVDNLIPELFDEDDLVNQNTDANKYYEKKVEDYSYLTAYFKSKENWETFQLDGVFGGTGIPEITIDNVDSVTYGAFFQRNDSYKTEDGEPAKLNWTDYLTLAGKKFTLFGQADVKPDWGTFLSLKDRKQLIFKGGYFIINMDYKLSQKSIANDSIQSSDAVYYDGKYSAGFKDTKFACRLKVGDYYWTGEEWKLYSDYLSNVAYYNKITSEGTIDYQKKFWYEENGQKIFITEQEYNKINLRDRFWLVRKNSVNDKIFDAWYSLTNQVSYKDNLINADEGVLIPLPENILYGELTFDICAPDSLGTIQNYRTDKEENYTYATYCHIKTLDFIYTNNKHYIDTFNQNQYDPDTLYSNVIDSENVTELDDLTLKVNTYTEKAGSYSYVITQNGTAYDYVDTLHNIAKSNDLKQEETIIQKYADYYSTPKFIYSNTLNNKEVKPYTVIHENTLNRNLVVNSTTYNLSTNSVSIVATEL